MKGAIFDFNGTLFYDSDIHFIAWKRFFEKRAIPVPSPEYFQKNFVGTTTTEIFKKHVDPNITPEQIAALSEEKENLYFDICLENPQRMHLNEGAEELFDLLSENNIPFMLATGSPKLNMDFYFRHLPIKKWFSYEKNIIYEDFSRRGKPDPAIYLAAAAHLGLPAKECVVFEDAMAGYLAARDAGVGGIVMVGSKRDTAMFRGLPGVSAIVEDLSEHRALLKTLGFTI